VDLTEHLRQARWFGGKSRTIVGTRVVDRACWVDESLLMIVDVEYANGAPDAYVVVDHLERPDITRALLESFRGARVDTEMGGMLEFRPTHLLGTIDRSRCEPVALMTAEQSNTSIRFGDALILKLFRRLQFGPNPDVEVGWFLTEHSQFRGTPGVAGGLEYVSADGRTASLALLQEFVPNRGDAWSSTLARLRAVLDGAAFDESIASIERLATTTADMHIALASGNGDFSREPITADDVSNWRDDIHAEINAAAEGLARHSINVDAAALLHRADGVAALEGAQKIRHHGDYHLGQVLERPDGAFVIIDFEGEPAKPLAQRREKRSPLRDVAGMLRSLDYACHAALRSNSGDPARAKTWYRDARQAFLDAYLADVRQHAPSLLPAEIGTPLAALELEKAAYEVLYELNNRPDWLSIPLAAIQIT
jgi:trehalose synthase-fused probable maltokinase